MFMRLNSRPLTITLNLPALDDEAVVELHDFLFEIPNLFEPHYGDQTHRFYQDRSSDNIIPHGPPIPFDDPPF